MIALKIKNLLTLEVEIVLDGDVLHLFLFILKCLLKLTWFIIFTPDDVEKMVASLDSAYTSIKNGRIYLDMVDCKN